MDAALGNETIELNYAHRHTHTSHSEGGIN